MITLFRYNEKQKWHIRNESNDWSLCGSVDYKNIYLDDYLDEWQVKSIEKRKDIVCKRCARVFIVLKSSKG
jgi:hypothetical protein